MSGAAGLSSGGVEAEAVLSEVPLKTQLPGKSGEPGQQGQPPLAPGAGGEGQAGPPAEGAEKAPEQPAPPAAAPAQPPSPGGEGLGQQPTAVPAAPPEAEPPPEAADEAVPEAEAAVAGAEAGTAAGAAAAAPPLAAALAMEGMLPPRKKWWLALFGAFAGLITFFGFFAGWGVMVRYWWQGRKLAPEKALSSFQKIATVILFFVPFVLLFGFVIGIIYIGCNTPIVGTATNFTLKSLGYGDVCKSLNSLTSPGVNSGSVGP